VQTRVVPSFKKIVTDQGSHTLLLLLETTTNTTSNNVTLKAPQLHKVKARLVLFVLLVYFSIVGNLATVTSTGDNDGFQKVPKLLLLSHIRTSKQPTK